MDVGHRTRIDWLHMPNLALIIGPYSPDLAEPIRKAAGIIEANMKNYRIPDDGFFYSSHRLTTKSVLTVLSPRSRAGSCLSFPPRSSVPNVPT